MQFADSACKVVKRVTDYLLQLHQKLFEPFEQIANGLWKYNKIRKELRAVLHYSLLIF
jgi:hypothetical protein